MTWQHSLILFGAAALAGAVNSVAGGGTLLTFPALLWSGEAAIVANATSTVALWPGQLSSLWGYRKEIGQSRTAIACLAVPSLLGGILGAYLLLNTPNKTFSFLVPYLILIATLLFMAQEPLSRWQKRRAEQLKSTQSGEAESVSDTEQDMAPDPIERLATTRAAVKAWAGVMVFQFGVAIYGGYFGAGIGILMLAALGFMGFTNIHRMNGLKNINGLCINAVAIGMFLVSRTRPGEGVGPQHNQLVDWPVALLMAGGAIVGGYLGAGTARRIGQKNVRRIIIAIGFALTISLLLKR